MTQEKDRYIVEKLGGCWHKPVKFINKKRPCHGWLCACGEEYSVFCNNHLHDNPDFTSEAGRVKLLKLVEKREGFGRFIAQINCLSFDEDGDLIDNCIPIDLMTDDTGKFRDVVYKWLGGEE